MEGPREEVATRHAECIEPCLVKVARRIVEGQMDAARIREHAEVYGSCGNRLGLVDRVEGGMIKMTRTSFRAGGQHHYVPLGWVEAAGDSIRLSKSCEEVREQWLTETFGAAV